MKNNHSYTVYEIKSTKKFDNQLKKLKKQNKDLSRLKVVISKLANNQLLDDKYRDHKLINNKVFNNCRECHIEPDWLLVYKKDKNKLILMLYQTGSHSDLFGL